MTKKGIVDPWRKVEPLRPAPRRPTPERKNLEDVDLDADLAIPGSCVIRTRHASIRVSHVRVETPKDALDVLAECVAALWRSTATADALRHCGIGVRCRSGAWNMPDDATPASTLKSSNATLWFIQQTLDQGVLALAKVLRADAASAAIKKWGITPMLNG